MPLSPEGRQQIQNQIANLQSVKAGVVAQIQAVNEKINTLQTQKAALVAQRDDINNQIQDLQADLNL